MKRSASFGLPVATDYHCNGCQVFVDFHILLFISSQFSIRLVVIHLFVWILRASKPLGLMGTELVACMRVRVVPAT